MSNKNKYSLQNEASATIQQKYNDTCFRLGQEIANERRAQENQATLMKQQAEIEKAYMIAVTREQETAARKQRDDKNKADAEAAKAQAAAALEPKA